MKKAIVIILFLAAVFGAIGASNVYAAGATAGTFYASSITMGDSTTMVFNLSKNVSMQYGKLLSGTVAAAYVICTFHSSGDKAVGSGSGADPGELQTLVPPGSAPSEGLVRCIGEISSGLGSLDRLSTKQLDDETVEQLRALGYLD